VNRDVPARQLLCRHDLCFSICHLALFNSVPSLIVFRVFSDVFPIDRVGIVELDDYFSLFDIRSGDGG
jgi:hypothetical protein